MGTGGARFYGSELNLVIRHTKLQSMETQEFLKLFPLGDENPQMSLWNGGIGEEQKNWLRKVLTDAERHNVKLIVAQHHPLIQGSAPSTHFLWNHNEISTMLVESPAVVLFLCGHYHPGGYACVSGKHFVTVEAILEAPTGSHAHGFVSVYEDKITIHGHGTVTSRELQISAAK
ncbi:manganese-dependent ADP-ribose/CDP-alcohol diphosphatase-like [Selaginella moellendorffii]|uniref:manganese-dependent ADP-ribose/CDP-alcohol diphosphatase-like n=1 Tax=Selaginella moellendorffii TaxID=88036 RepID=UPI000D1CCB57|nr:manganese-dependent ADP-ribose/CDP-alcohol diphosphatase-like [Selaginella moellendorffii]|eukprot:XP_024537776.1 manganese-dependent ADP-ribose/CDP-alcohol diphosphatase-like [Selaginella moellendorffii]